MLGYILNIFPQVMEQKAIPVHPSCFTQLTTEHQKLTFVNWKSRRNNSQCAKNVTLHSQL